MLRAPDGTVHGTPYYFGGPFDGHHGARTIPLVEELAVEDGAGVRHVYRNVHAVTVRGAPIYVHEHIRRLPWS